MNGGRRIVAYFDAVASRYEQHAGPQAHAAARLAEGVAGLSLPEAPRILEIGCGTGLLTRHLTRLYPRATILASDRSLAMLRVARAHLAGETRLRFVAMDGEAPSVRPGFDLICANLAWQWFAHPLQSVARCRDLLNPGGWLSFSTLGEANFAEWRALCTAHGVAHGLHDYPSLATWRAHLPPNALLSEERHPTEYSSALAFLHALRAIGAQAPAYGHRPLPAGTLRRVLRGQSEKYSSSYHFLYIHLP
ncbi:MAG: methyltransferase domain-containing protein [Magnetococcales bacterium]|nr:methyltransferase domain-containing protein [Magnetococcales bacterium]